MERSQNVPVPASGGLGAGLFPCIFTQACRERTRFDFEADEGGARHSENSRADRSKEASRDQAGTTASIAHACNSRGGQASIECRWAVRLAHSCQVSASSRRSCLFTPLLDPEAFAVGAITLPKFRPPPQGCAALACIAVCFKRHRLGVFREPNSPENFADKIGSLRRGYAFGDAVRVS
jgi:hypothetical protein